METIHPSKNCRSCGKPIRGRSDKKFCGDGCRSLHNTPLRTESTRLVRFIESAIRRNRHVLETLLDTRVTRKVCREELLDAGFSFRYHTHSQIRGTQVSHFCYEFGFRETISGHYRIWKEEKLR